AAPEAEPPDPKPPPPGWPDLDEPLPGEPGYDEAYEGLLRSYDEMNYDEIAERYGLTDDDLLSTG
ncbi:hypothetical protein KV112_20525, partial [Mycolicibacter sp. MYC123]|nr:hypothetical protein [Mycolicibacter sp. MYC123]